MTILSWNYDVQFEMAYSGYFTTERYIPSLWKELNVFNKKYPTEFNVDAPFAMVKLNGTALFTDASKNEWEVNGKKVNNITDCFYGGHNHTPYQYGYEYLNRGTLNVETLGRGFAWLDTGNHDMLLAAADFVYAFQKRQGLYISCIEEIAYKRGFISKEQLIELAQPLLKTDYGKYLMEVAEGL